MLESISVQGPTLARLAMVFVLEAGGKPATRFPPEGPVDFPTFPWRGNFEKREKSYILKVLPYACGYILPNFDRANR